MFEQLKPGALLRDKLLAADRAIRIGGVQHLDFEFATVVTHDRWKHDAGGIPQFSFLLATAIDDDPASDSDEVLLLRVEDTAPLSLETDLHAVREEALRNALSKDEKPTPQQVLDVALDPFTRNRAAYTGLKCRVLGTFYEEQAEGQTRIVFGSDIDNYYAIASYRVLKPINDGLSFVASFLKPDQAEVQRVRIGAVRFAATQRRARTAGQDDAPVEINMKDFIGHKTALLGMTRTGKSNTAKVLIARTFIASQERVDAGGSPIGQLIFDPQGEYANANTQDGTEIAAIGADHVRIFKFGADGSEPHVRPLGINFYDEKQIEMVQGMVADILLTDGASGYVKDFGQTSFAIEDPNDRSTATRVKRARLVLYSALKQAGFAPPAGWTIDVPVNKDLKPDVEQEASISLTPAGAPGSYRLTLDQAEKVVKAVAKLSDGGNTHAQEWTKDPRWSATYPIYAPTSGRRGWRNLFELKPFHNSATKHDITEEIYTYLVEGKIVIVDLHIGTAKVITSLSENIAASLLVNQTKKFTNAEEPPSIQLMLEEAHNLFDTEKYKKDGDVWVRLAKEASKLKLGMTYATQEVSGVAHQVRANTVNWVVAHLNNDRELRELGGFYDFAAHAPAIKSSEDKGYVRLKTLSSPYIVPVQIDVYSRDLVNLARASAGLPALED